MRVLAITMLDLRQEPNQRTQHVVRMLAAWADETLVVSKVKVMDRRWWAVLRDALRVGVERRSVDGVRMLSLHPPLNYAQALAAGLVEGSVVQRPGRLRRALATGLSALGIVRDALLVPSFVATVLAGSRGRYDLCLADGPWAGVAALVLRALGRVRVVYYDDIDHVAGGQMLAVRRWYVEALERFAIRRADLAVSAGWLLAEHRRRSTGRDLPVIPNGVDAVRFGAARDRALARAAERAPVLVYVGHLSHYAGVDLAIEALPRIATAVPGARLLVVGDGDAPYVAGLHALAGARGVADRVRFAGRVPYSEVPELLAGCTLGLSTFRLTPLGRYAFPLKVVEYMAAGLPVLCTRGTEAEQILLRYPAGRAVAFDAGALASAAITLLSDPAAAAAARAAAAVAARDLTWERTLAAERELLLPLLPGGRAQQASVRA
jgi:glycosyltransferase involved in cell wall biosynthesis